MQGDTTNSPYSPLLPQPGLTHLTLTLGGRRTITPHIGGGVKSEAGWKSLLMDAISILSQQNLCHCRQEATNATRIIHDNYDQVREGERTGEVEMQRPEWAASSLLKFIHLLNSIDGRSAQFCVC